MSATGGLARVGPRRRAGRLVRSVRFRITAIAAVAVLLVLVVAGVLLLSLQRRQLIDNLDRSLIRRADDLTVTAQDFDAEQLADPPIVLADGAGDDAVVQIVSVLDRVVVAGTANAVGIGPIAPEPPGEDYAIATVDTLPVEDDEYRLLSHRIEIGGRPHILHVAENTDEQRELIGDLRNAVLLIVPFAVALLAGVVWWLVGRTLSPVEAIRREVAGMGADQLERRVPRAGTGDEIDRLAETMNGLIERLEEATRRQQQFVADASHELRSPLARVRTELEVEAAAPSDRRRPVDATFASVIEEIDDMAALVDDLLALARSDAGRASIEPRPVDLDDLVLDEVTRARAGSGNVTVGRDGVSAALVRGDPGELRRVVRNLLDNAVRHASARVDVTLTETNASDGGPMAVLTVADDGAGITPDQAATIFDRFSRVDDARSRAAGGTGLGLAISRDIVERHGGRIAVDTEVARGARFVVQLPTDPR